LDLPTPQTSAQLPHLSISLDLPPPYPEGNANNEETNNTNGNANELNEEVNADNPTNEEEDINISNEENGGSTCTPPPTYEQIDEETETSTV